MIFKFCLGLTVKKSTKMSLPIINMDSKTSNDKELVKKKICLIIDNLYEQFEKEC
jgi:hypothetical protein